MGNICDWGRIKVGENRQDLQPSLFITCVTPFKKVREISRRNKMPSSVAGIISVSPTA